MMWVEIQFILDWLTPSQPIANGSKRDLLEQITERHDPKYSSDRMKKMRRKAQGAFCCNRQNCVLCG